MKLHSRSRFAVGLFALAALAGCSSSEPETTAESNETNMVEMTNIEEPEALPTEAPVENVTTPAPLISNDMAMDSQIQEDADATGMTAHVSRDAPAGDAGQPTQ